MGLYDNYRAINSQTVSSFVPDKSKDIRDFIDRGNQRYEATQNYLASTTDALKTVPVREEDQGLYQQVSQEAQQKLAEFASRPDLENITGDVYKYATHVAGKLKDLAGAKKVEQDYMSALQSKDYGLDADTQKKLYAMSKDRSTPIQYDQYGRVVGGFSGVAPAKAVDKTEKIRKYLSIMPQNENKISVKGISSDGQIEYMDSKGNKTVLPENIRTTLMAAISSDPELQAWDNQEAMINAHFATKGVSDEAVLAALQSAPKNSADAVWHDELKAQIAKGIPPSEALKSVEQDRQLNAVRSRELQYALGATKNDYSSEVSNMPSAYAMEDYKAKKQQETDAAKVKLEKQDRLITEGATYNIKAWAKDSEDLEKNLTNFDTNIADLKTAIETKDRLAKQAEGYNKTALLSEKAQLENELQTISGRKDALTQAKGLVLDRAAQAIGVPTFEQLKEKATPSIVSELKKTYPNGIKSLKGETIPYEAIADALIKGNIKTVKPKYVSTNTPGGSLPNTSVVEYNGQQYEFRLGRGSNNGNTPALPFFMEDQKNRSLKLVNQAQEKAKEYIKEGLSLKTSSIGVTDKDQELLKGIVQQSPITFDDGSTERPEDADYSKATFSDYSKSLGTVRVTVPTGKGEYKSGIMDVQKSDYNEKVGADLGLSKNLNQQKLARDVAYNNSSRYQEKLGPGSVITIHPVTGSPLEIGGQSFAIQRVGNLFNVVYDETPEVKDNRGNTSVKPVKSFVELNGKPLQNKSMSEIESLLNDLIDHAARSK